MSSGAVATTSTRTLGLRPFILVVSWKVQLFSVCLTDIVMSQSVSLSTVQNWEKDVDSLREWLPYDQSGGKLPEFFVNCATSTGTASERSGISTPLLLMG